MIRFFEKFPEVIAAFSDCADGNLSLKFPIVKGAREKFMRGLGLDIANLVTADQPHSNKVAVVRAIDRGRGAQKKDWLIGYDALITDDKHVALGICTADCVPVFMYFPREKIIVAAHLGWRCVVSGLIFNIAEILKKQFSCQLNDGLTAIGPHIRPCCFEVKEDVARNFESYENAVISRGTKIFIDLTLIIKKQLQQVGFNLENLEESLDCTCCKHKYYSVRRLKNDPKKRMLGVISLKNKR